jgi:hypothetical protein
MYVQSLVHALIFENFIVFCLNETPDFRADFLITFGPKVCALISGRCRVDLGDLEKFTQVMHGRRLMRAANVSIIEEYECEAICISKLESGKTFLEVAAVITITYKVQSRSKE